MRKAVDGMGNEGCGERRAAGGEMHRGRPDGTGWGERGPSRAVAAEQGGGHGRGRRRDGFADGVTVSVLECRCRYWGAGDE